MRLFRKSSVALLVLALPVTAAAAEFHLEFHAAVPSPIGTWGDVPASDYFGVVGSGFTAIAMIQRDAQLGFGVRSGLLQNWNEAPVTFTVLGDPVAGEVERELTNVPTMGFVRYRLTQMDKATVYGEAGLGVHSYTGKVRLRASGSDAVVSAEYQNDFAMFLGGGITVPLHRLLAVGLGIEFQQAFTGDGDLWSSGDNPSFIVSRFGLRYPR